MIGQHWRSSNFHWAFVGACLLNALSVTDAWGLDRMLAPKVVMQSRQTIESKQARGGAIRHLIRFFRASITLVDGNRCPMYPTCSHYAEQALAKHGPTVGTLLLVDRLFHEWSEMSVAPTLEVHGVERFWDPLEENDFWLTGKHLISHPSPKE